MCGVGLEGLGVSKMAKGTPNSARSHHEMGKNREEKKEENTFSEGLQYARPCFSCFVCFTTLHSVKQAFESPFHR